MHKMKGDIFHILNRGVEKRKIFLDEEDYLRFVYNLYDFNDINNVAESYYQRREKSYSDVRRPNDEIVDVLCWCLMPNHIHLLVQEKVNGGASLYSKKIIGGYTKYFNDNNKRSGVLFQGRSKIIPIKKDKHFIHMPYYIFSNPIKLIEPKWKENGVRDLKKAVNFVEKYKWSSFPNVSRKPNFQFTVNKNSFFKLFDTNEKQFKKDFFEWISVS